MTLLQQIQKRILAILGRKTVRLVLAGAKPGLAIAKLAFTPLSIGFVLYFAWQGRDLLNAVIQNASLWHVLVAVLLWLAFHCIVPIFSLVILNQDASTLTYRRMLGIYANRLPTKYIPGGLWLAVSRVMDFHKLNVSPNFLAIFLFLDFGLAAAVPFMMGGTTVYIYRGWEGWGQVGALCALAGLSFTLLSPFIVNRIILAGDDRLESTRYMKAVATMGLVWTIVPLAFVAYLSAFPNIIGGTTALEIGGTYVLSWAIGFVTVFAPQGIGVLEAAAGSMIQSPISFGGVATLVAGFRLVTLLADIIVWCVGRVFWAYLDQIDLVLPTTTAIVQKKREFEPYVPDKRVGGL